MGLSEWTSLIAAIGVIVLGLAKIVTEYLTRIRLDKLAENIEVVRTDVNSGATAMRLAAEKQADKKEVKAVEVAELQAARTAVEIKSTTDTDLALANARIVALEKEKADLIRQGLDRKPYG